MVIICGWLLFPSHMIASYFILGFSGSPNNLILFQGFTEPSSDKLLPDLHPMEQGAFTLVLDLNETLIYSDWTV